MAVGGDRRGSWSEVEFDAVAAAWRLDPGVVAEAGGVSAAEVSDGFGEGVEFPVELVESSGCFGMLFEPPGAFPLGSAGVVSVSLEVVDGLVEAAGFGSGGVVVGGLCGGFLLGAAGGFLGPTA